MHPKTPEAMSPVRPFNTGDQKQPSWLDRARHAAALVKAIPARTGSPLVLADVGCGDMKLKRVLHDEGIAPDYRPYDLVPQAPEVTPLDIQLQDLPHRCDAVVLLGVVEYLASLPAVLARLAGRTRYLVVSHVVSDYSKYTPERLAELGWKHHLARADFGRMLSDAGFRIEQETVTANGRTVLWLCRSLHPDADA
jgi:hypothetical protein